jgi:hypothetical protein
MLALAEEDTDESYFDNNSAKTYSTRSPEEVQSDPLYGILFKTK